MNTLLLPQHRFRPPGFVLSTQIIHIRDYQLYAVEKWIVDRAREVTLLVVYTGDPAHSISLAAYTTDDQAAWHSALALLRADGARPKQTLHGVLMATSLAHFRSDYTIVQIPAGDFLAVHDQLYANINLLRMGCSGRTALTLEDPSDTTKDRFLSTYHLPDTALVTTILELVKLIQAGLAIFGLFGPIDGLLCDHTIDAIRTWIADVGGPCIALEPTERIADPMFVSGLLSLVLAIRNKLAYLGFSHVLPRDPFLHPNAFSLALASYIHSSPPVNTSPYPQTIISSHLSISYHAHFIPPAPPPANILSAAAAAAAQVLAPVGAILTRELVENICSAYEAKQKAENRRVRRVIKNRLAPDSDGAEDRERERRTHVEGAASSSNVASPGDQGTNTIGASGGQILSGIGNFASGLGRSGGAGSSSSLYGDASSLTVATTDLAGFVSLAASSSSAHGGNTKSRERRRESVDIGIGYAQRELKDKDARAVAGSVKALWSGRVADIRKMREDSPVAKKRGEGRGIASDGDAEESWREGGKKYDGRSTEDESDVIGSGDGSVSRFGGMWSGRVRGKLGSLAGFTKRKHQSVDISSTSSSLQVPPRLTKLDIGTTSSLNTTPGGGRSNRPMNPRRSTTTGGSRTQSPTLPPMVFSGEPDDDDLLSSGQVSPLSDYRPSPFNLITGTNSGNRSASGSTTHLDSRAVSAKLLSQNLNQGLKRPFAVRRISQTARVSSWADPVSARGLDGDPEDGDDDADESGPHGIRRRGAVYEDDEEESDISELRGQFGKRKEKARFHSLLSVVDGEGVLAEEPMEDSQDELDNDDEEEEEEDEERGEEKRRRSRWFDPRRRRSFHDLDGFGDIEVLKVSRMRIDVELCGQLLIMSRRGEHLRNVVACVRHIANSLSQTNTVLRTHYESHLSALQSIDTEASVFASIEEETLRTERLVQATHALRYESDQFNVPDLWQAASPPRHKVFSLREKVFGTGGRRLPPGVDGAHGAFNRLQWSLDGQKRLVDHLGRTEEEANEERRIDPQGLFGRSDEEADEEDVVEHPGIKPMWLLRFFTSWGARWSAATATVPPPPPSASGKEGDAKSPLLSPSPPAVSLSPSAGEKLIVDDNIPLVSISSS